MPDKAYSILRETSGERFSINWAEPQLLNWLLSLVEKPNGCGPRCIRLETHGPIGQDVRKRTNRNVSISAIHVVDNLRTNWEFIGLIVEDDGTHIPVQGFYSLATKKGHLEFLE